MDIGAVHQVVGPGHHDEQEQWRLDSRGEHRALAHREHRRQAADNIERGENPGQFLAARAEIDSETDCGREGGDQDCSPPGNSSDVGMC